jgi:hypothetical protein
MFQGSIERLRALRDAFEEIVDDILGHPADDELAPAPHPHRRPARLLIERRPGQVAPRPAHCVSPVRPSTAAAREAIAKRA